MTGRVFHHTYVAEQFYNPHFTQCQVELWGVTDLFVPRHQLKNVTSALEKHGFLYEVMVPDVQRYSCQKIIRFHSTLI